MTELTIVLNFIIIFLLVTAIVYGFVLNKRITLIKQSGKELRNLFRSFDDTILTAQNSVEDLKRASAVIADGLQKKIDKAAIIIDDLEFLNEKGERGADKLGAVIANFKKIENRIPVSSNEKSKTPVLKMPTSPPMPTRSSVPPKQAKPLGKKALEDLLNEAAGMSGSGVKIESEIKNKRPANTQTEAEKRQFSIASALKALGYGE